MRAGTEVFVRAPASGDHPSAQGATGIRGPRDVKIRARNEEERGTLEVVMATRMRGASGRAGERASGGA
jgi:hypothetical protein